MRCHLDREITWRDKLACGQGTRVQGTGVQIKAWGQGMRSREKIPSWRLRFVTRIQRETNRHRIHRTTCHHGPYAFTYVHSRSRVVNYHIAFSQRVLVFSVIGIPFQCHLTTAGRCFRGAADVQHSMVQDYNERFTWHAHWDNGTPMRQVYLIIIIQYQQTIPYCTPHTLL